MEQFHELLNIKIRLQTKDQMTGIEGWIKQTKKRVCNETSDKVGKIAIEDLKMKLPLV